MAEPRKLTCLGGSQDRRVVTFLHGARHAKFPVTDPGMTTTVPGLPSGRVLFENYRVERIKGAEMNFEMLVEEHLTPDDVLALLIGRYGLAQKQPPETERQAMFAVSYEGQLGDPDRVPVLILGIPQGAWDYMEDGRTHTFDLSRTLGLPIKLIMFGGPTRASIHETLVDAQRANGKAVVDATDQDFAMKPIDKPDEPAS